MGHSFGSLAFRQVFLNSLGLGCLQKGLARRDDNLGVSIMSGVHDCGCKWCGRRVGGTRFKRPRGRLGSSRVS